MRVVAAPQLDQQSGQHYVPATQTNSGQHYIPAFANGQFSIAQGSYQTIPQQYYQSIQPSTKLIKSQPKQTNSRNDLNSNEKYQQTAATRSNYYYKV